jgi:hypothetical protein
MPKYYTFISNAFFSILSGLGIYYTYKSIIAKLVTQQLHTAEIIFPCISLTMHYPVSQNLFY